MSALTSSTSSSASSFNLSDCIELLSLPSRPEEVDTNKLLKRERDLADFIHEFHNKVGVSIGNSVFSKLIRYTLKRIEGPWAPHDHALPKD